MSAQEADAAKHCWWHRHFVPAGRLGSKAADCQQTRPADAAAVKVPLRSSAFASHCLKLTLVQAFALYSLVATLHATLFANSSTVRCFRKSSWFVVLAIVAQVKVAGFSEDDQAALYNLTQSGKTAGKQGLGVGRGPKKV